MPENPAYLHLWGPGLFPSGALADWTCRDRLDAIRSPTVVLVGRHDGLTVTCSETIRAGVPDAEIHIFEDSSHLPHLEEPERFREVVDGFLSR
jgi:L-proline amide hydrolase